MLIHLTASPTRSAYMSMSQSYTVGHSVRRDLKGDTLPETPADDSWQMLQKEAKCSTTMSMHQQCFASRLSDSYERRSRRARPCQYRG
ncbi:hypothetical protein BD310DRAFT_931488 [Dichomitus squalens]|uniref:Uncharacterized protein n=1 Tax=Dichomitus squalens TaxID=114155 RepID=A0A4V2K7K9_9APHY|nr:hypothetical protein BD310DRAFT_931488 [Dichomitus squalens]